LLLHKAQPPPGCAGRPRKISNSARTASA